MLLRDTFKILQNQKKNRDGNEFEKLALQSFICYMYACINIAAALVGGKKRCLAVLWHPGLTHPPVDPLVDIVVFETQV